MPDIEGFCDRRLDCPHYIRTQNSTGEPIFKFRRKTYIGWVAYRKAVTSFERGSGKHIRTSLLEK